VRSGDLDQRARYRVAVLRVLGRQLAEKARPKCDVTVLVAGDLVEALDESGQRPDLLVVLEGLADQPGNGTDADNPRT
jgi:hypothetical protein